MTYDKELQRIKRINADLFAWKEGKKGIEEYYSMVSQRDAVRAEKAALRDALDNAISLLRRWNENDVTDDVVIETRKTIHAARKEAQP